MTSDTHTQNDGTDAPPVPGDGARPVERATRVARLAKFVAVTLAALATAAKALGLL